MPSIFLLNPSMSIAQSRTDMEVLSIVFVQERSYLTDPTEQVNADMIIQGTQKLIPILNTDTLSLENKKIYRDTLEEIRNAYKTFASSDNGAIIATRSHIDALATTTDYVPWWIITLISIAIGSGTLVGWKRIVKTIGEKIGKYKMNYSQAASSALVTAGTI